MSRMIAFFYGAGVALVGLFVLAGTPVGFTIEQVGWVGAVLMSSALSASLGSNWHPRVK